MRARRIQIGLVAATAAAGALLTLAPAAGVGAVKADVTLQVVPRGHGTLVSDAATGATVCDASEEPNDCRRTFAAGTTVVLSPRPTGSSAVRWSTPDCPGAGACRVTVDEDTSIVVLLGKLTLSVQTSEARSGDVVTSDSAGISCPPACEAEFDAGADREAERPDGERLDVHQLPLRVHIGHRNRVHRDGARPADGGREAERRIGPRWRPRS